jgi:hypothetical protein
MDLVRWLRNQWDRATAVILTVVGLISVLAGWLGVSRSGLPTEQLPYLASGAVLGLFALGMAATLWLSADLRDEWRVLNNIYRTMRAERDEAPTGPEVDLDEPAPDLEQRPGNGARRRVPAPADTTAAAQ